MAVWVALDGGGSGADAGVGDVCSREMGVGDGAVISAPWMVWLNRFCVFMFFGSFLQVWSSFLLTATSLHVSTWEIYSLSVLSVAAVQFCHGSFIHLLVVDSGCRISILVISLLMFLWLSSACGCL